MRTWESLTEEERQAAIKKHSRFLDPVQARKNWETHERADEANRRSSEMAAAQRLVSGWITEDGTIIPKTVEGIELHQELVIRLRAKFPRIRLNPRNTELRYKVIRQKAEHAKKYADASARFKREAAQRKKATIEREKRIAVEKWARIQEEAASAIKEAKGYHKRMSEKVLDYEKKISVKTGQIARVTARIAEIEAVLPSYKGTSLYYKMKALLPPARKRLADRIIKLTQYQQLLKDNQERLRDNAVFLVGKGVVPQTPQRIAFPRTINLEKARWRRKGKYLYPRGRFDKVQLLNIWVRPAGTGKLRIFSRRALMKEIDWVKFGSFKLALTNPRKGFFCADLTADQVNSL